MHRSLILPLLIGGLLFHMRVTEPTHATTIPPQSTFFASVQEESYSTYQMPGDGDLWPSCWADDDNLYAANGDGTAFSNFVDRLDMAVGRISGIPPNLTG